MKKPGLLIFILFALILGVVVGIVFPAELNIETGKKESFATDLKLLSDIFMLLIKMIIGPLVLSVLIVGVAKVGDFKSVGRIGAKTLGYFLAATVVALLVGLILVNLFEPGKNMALELPDEMAETGIEHKGFVASEFIKHVIPDSVFKALSNNEILPIVVFSLFFGIAAASMGEKAAGVVKFFESVSHIMFKVTNYVMAFAPLGVLGAVAAVVAQQGADVLLGYLYLIGCFFGGLLFFVFVVLWGLCAILRIPFLRLLGMIKEPVVLAFSTASSEAAMPQTMKALEKYGCPDRVVGFVLPLGYSFNLDGSIMYMTFATIFIAQAYGIEMGFDDQLTMMLIFMLTSKGMAGVPRASLVVIAGMLSTYNIPEQGLLLLLGVDQILDMGRSATNVVGNAVATCVVSKWEGELKT
ncbi:MAG: dicarboxylate/amino acid:cation symporter [Flavobacteriales bacterium]